MRCLVVNGITEEKINASIVAIYKDMETQIKELKKTISELKSTIEKLDARITVLEHSCH